jgi:hypothetical protein
MAFEPKTMPGAMDEVLAISSSLDFAPRCQVYASATRAGMNRLTTGSISLLNDRVDSA